MRLSIIAAALAFLAIPTIAAAHGGNTNPNTVHACIGNVSKVVRVVAVNGSCIAAPSAIAETPAHWAIQGPQGAPGTNGTNGAMGTPGTNGTNGAPGVPGTPGINGTNGSDGADGTNGTNGTDGTSVTFVGNFSGSEHGCPNGGAILAIGATPAYVCNGQDAAMGATRPDGPCFHNTNRYVNCGNGTVTDTVTGLIWLQQADCLAITDWAAANVAAANVKDTDCGLTDGSSPGDWRLPTKAEWAATLVQAWALSCHNPGMTDDAGTGCRYDGGAPVGPSSFSGVQPELYWSSSTYEVFPIFAWVANHFSAEGVGLDGKNATNTWAWPVRGGPR